MPPVTINYLAVAVAALASMAIGFLWYGAFFGQAWTRAMGWGELTAEKKKEMQAKAGPGYAVSLVGALIMAYVLSHFVDYAQATSAAEGLQTGFWTWLGFVAPVLATETIFGGKPWSLFGINAGFRLAELLAMGLILVLIV